MLLHRRRFLAAGLAAAGGTLTADSQLQATNVLRPDSLESWIPAQSGKWDIDLYRRMLGAASEFKEGDAIVGVAARSDQERQLAKQLLGRTTIGFIDSHPPHQDELLSFINTAIDPERQKSLAELTVDQLRAILLRSTETEIHSLRMGLSSDVIACVTRLMTSEELIQLGARVFNPLPGSQIGARGYMGARVQPNSPTDNVDDIRWQVFDAFSYAVGDVLLGTNPVSSDPKSVAAVESTLREIVQTFGLSDILPHCVLSHIDIQAEVEQQQPELTALWFQSIAGNDTANRTFDISVEKMRAHARRRTGPFALYFETGQGADFTNGHGHGVDMLTFESRKYGFARALTRDVSQALQNAGKSGAPWVHLNDVAGFIGPEVFRTREQLVRCCLEDIVMGKLHGLTIGLDICSTLHMDVSLDDLGWCIEQVMPANPAYLMALPTRIDPMLGYLTTGYHDHVRIREQFGYRVNDRMWRFFETLGVIDASGQPTQHFGNPAWVYLRFCRLRQDARTDREILQEAAAQIEEVRGRGVFIAEGSGTRQSDLQPGLAKDIQRIYSDAKECIWREFEPGFSDRIAGSVRLQTTSADRLDYILHPATGEILSEDSVKRVSQIRTESGESWDTQIIISDGLNALAVTESDQLHLLLRSLHDELPKRGHRVAPQHLIVHGGRVRAGYRIGELLFAGRSESCSLLHIIGERPGSGHRTMSVYLTTAAGTVWGTRGVVDHNITRVVSGIAHTALSPVTAGQHAARILSEMRSL